jgi:Transposase DDE domain/Insertion element 4 transposase N-terminal
MAHATRPSPNSPVAHACRQLIRAPGLPFAEQLPETQVDQALRAEGASFRHRLFSPAVTLWTFLSQVLDADPSCRQAVARFRAWRAARGLAPCSPDPGAYCKARTRLPEAALRRLTRDTGGQVLAEAPADWLWLGHPVKVIDGTGLSMPDTPANQKEYPQASGAKPGCGFPLMRLVVLFSLAVGTVLDAALGAHKGKGTGEQTLGRALGQGLEPGDVLLGDRNFCSYWTLTQARGRGADAVLRLHTAWEKDARAGRRLGPGDRLLRLRKPRRPAWMTEADYAAVPDELWVRTVQVRVRQRGFRTRALMVVTTLLDPQAVGARQLAELYRARWQAELDLRSLKQTLQMDILRGQSPEMVRKEVWAHLLAYNLVRALMARAALQAGCRPRELSVAGAVQELNAFLPHLRAARGAEEAARLWGELLVGIAQHRVGNRPDRVEPRQVKRRPKNYPWLKEPRAQARARLKATT